MFLREERIAILILLCTTAVILFVYATIELQGRQIYATEFDLTAPDGTLVRLSGVAERVVTTREGGHIIMNVNSVRVFVPASAAPREDIRQGDLVSLYGVVQTYQGQKEIVISSARDILILPPSAQS